MARGVRLLTVRRSSSSDLSSTSNWADLADDLVATVISNLGKPTSDEHRRIEGDRGRSDISSVRCCGYKRFRGSSHGWFFFTEKKLELVLLNPISGKIIRLPPLKQCGRKYNIDVGKAILSNDPSVGSFEVLAMYNNSNVVAHIKFGDKFWTYADFNMFSSVTFYNDVILGASTLGAMMSLNATRSRLIGKLFPYINGYCDQFSALWHIANLKGTQKTKRVFIVVGPVNINSLFTVAVFIAQPSSQENPSSRSWWKPICESMIIVEYIEETWPSNPLFPSDPYERAQARFWINYADDKGVAIWRIFRSRGEEQEKFIEECLEMLRILEEQALGDKKFFGGDEIGIVDIVFGGIAHWLGVIEEIVGVKLLEANEFPHLHAWTNNFKEIPVIRQNLPNRHDMLVFYKGVREKLFGYSSSSGISD
ncbi:hypothetical protein FNV43_RR02161 [Rhamnella rubrinervis]|uniref:glutathione transferase n=1 Tax=Rhamnella rubrinervis TaxID=2594499 RepID=A0A8K0HSP5_9ROSA|nr:hypothetical protein FNV43_RR02161 [Rhamnella rubrinervis]